MLTKIFTPLTLIGTIALVVIFNHLTGFELHSFTFFFIIPIGALLVGAAAASGLFLGLLKDNKPVTKQHYILGLILGVVAFYGIYYVDYKTTYVTENKEISYTFEGDPISYYEIDGEQITFSKFLKLSNGGSQFYFRGRPIGEEVDPGETANSFFFYLNVVAAALAGAVVGLTIVGDKKYCQKCKKYNKEKELFKFEVEKYEEVVNKLVNSIEKPSALKEIISTYGMKKDAKVTAFAQVDLDYCPTCDDAKMHIKVLKLDGDNFQEVGKFRQTIPVSQVVVFAFTG